MSVPNSVYCAMEQIAIIAVEYFNDSTLLDQELLYQSDVDVFPPKEE